MNDESLLEHLLAAYERAYVSGETALQLGIGYSAKNKTFSMDIGGTTHALSAHHVADFAEGGDAVVEDIKRWARGGEIG